LALEQNREATEVVKNAEEAAAKAVRHPWVRALSGSGFYAKGILFIVVGTLAIFLSAGLRGGRITDPTGALNAIGQLRMGGPLLFFMAVGALGHGVWNILRGIGDVDDNGGGIFGILTRSIAVCIGLFYVWLAFNAASFLFLEGETVTSGDVERSITAILISVPLGILIVLFLGLGFFGAAIHEFYSGVSGKYQEHYRLWQMETFELALVTVLGILSFSTRAVIYLLVSYFFLASVFLLDPAQVRGFDGALLALAQTKYGGLLLLAAGFGLVCHGILAFFEAKYRRIC